MYPQLSGGKLTTLAIFNLGLCANFARLHSHAQLLALETYFLGLGEHGHALFSENHLWCQVILASKHKMGY
jgi:hypothetical protein